MAVDGRIRDQVLEVLEDFLASTSLADAVLHVAITFGQSTDLELVELEGFQGDPQVESAYQSLVVTDFEYSFRVTPIHSESNDEEWTVSSLRLGNELLEQYSIVAHVITGRAPHSRLPPLVLRSLAQILEVAVLEVDGQEASIEKYELAGLASRSRVTSIALEAVADCCRASGVILWHYDYESESYKSIDGYGPVGRSYQVGLAVPGRSKAERRGIVSQALPGVSRVVYSVKHASDRIPPSIGDWVPHDPEVLTANGWDACVAWPILAGGHLLGALSIYGLALENLNYSRTVRNAATIALSEFLRDIDMRSELTRSEEAFEEELSKNSNGRLAGELVHDYKTALDSIDNLLKNLKRSQLSTGMQAMYDKSQESIGYLKKVTRSLGKLAKGQRSTGKTDLASTIWDSEAFLRALVANVDPSVKLKLRVPRQLQRSQSCTIEMDDLTALRVVSNLVENAAIWCRGEDHPEVVVSISAAELGRGSVRFRSDHVENLVLMNVRDNGPGVQREDRGKIFQRGWSNRREDGGSGLGLYIVRKAVEKAEGSISEVGRVGSGANFEVKLPPLG